MLSNGDRRIRAMGPPRHGRFPRLLYLAIPICYVPWAAVTSVGVHALARDYCDLISAQIDGQTTVINRGRWPAARPPDVRPGSIGNIIVLIP